MVVAALILFIGITWYPEPGIKPDYQVVPAKSIEECRMMKMTYELSQLVANADGPETTWVHPQGYCITLTSDASRLPA